MNKPTFKGLDRLAEITDKIVELLVKKEQERLDQIVKTLEGVKRLREIEQSGLGTKSS